MDSKPSKARSPAVDAQIRVSAVVVTRATGQPLELCLRSALAEPWVDELIIVDNGSPRPVSSGLRALQADRRDVLLVQGQGDIGLAAGANLGAARARGRWLLFLDPSVVLQRGAVERMAAAGGQARSPWIVGARLTDTRGRDRRSSRKGALTAWSALAVAMGVGGASLKPRRRKPATEPVDMAAVSGEMMLIPRADFEALGGFDEGYASDAADLDLCRRATELGGRVLVEPAASGVHFFADRRPARHELEGLARFMRRAARTPGERAIAAMAHPALATIVVARKLGRVIFGAVPN